MKPTQQQIADARKVYDLFWDSYMKGDVDTFASTLDDTFEMIGTSESERCHTKADGIEFFKGQIEELIGKAEMRNRQISEIPVEGMVLVNEHCDIYILAETDWNFYSKIRISTFLRETPGGWKVAQQHGSFPDMRVQEGETLAIEKINRENLELRDAIKRRTAELETKNRELEIEASLERVRARSMAMQKSDELHDVLSVLFEQFDVLGIRPVNVFLSLFSREERTLTYRATGTGGSRTQGQQVVSLDSLDVWQELFEKWKNDNSDSVEVIYYEREILPMLFGLLEDTFSAMPEKERLSIEHFPDGGYTAHGYTPFGYIGYNHTLEPTEEEKDILTKFASEFSRVYQRFLDIEKAEAQARESEIQLALEKVRARSMAMNNSDELTDLLSVLFEQFDNLGIKPLFAHLTLFDQEDDSFSFRMTGFEGQRVLVEHIINIQEMDAWQSAYQQWKDGEENTISCIDYPPDVLPALFEVMGPIFHALPEGSEMKIEDYPGGLFTTQANCKYGYLGFNHKRRATEEEKDIAIRFAKEFSRAYQRFLDIKKAEAQKRESEIQLALERVRARTMAMQNSEELADTSAVLFEQMKILGVTPERMNVCLVKEDSKELEIWSTDQDGVKINHRFTASFDEPTTGKKAYKAWKKGVKSTTITLTGDELSEWITYVREEMNMDISDERVKGQRIHSLASFSHGMLITTTSEPLSPDSIRLMERFAEVFNLTYTRFLDLQKAEEQAREAEIEASLERVRAKGLAMHSTEEIESATAIVFNELSRLGVEMERCGITIMNETPIAELWSTTLSQETKEVIDIVTGHLDFRIHPLTQQSYQDWKEKKKYSTYYLVGDELQKYYDKLEKQPGYKFPKAANYPDQQILHSFFFSEGTIFVYTTTDLPTEAKKILHRFTNVFEQTYTRFLDLQKAEKLAVESSRQASLDRIRAEIGSMRSSDDLHQITPIIWDELKALAIPFIRCGVFIIDEKDDISHTYLSTSKGDPIAALHLPVKGISLVENVRKFWKNGEIYTKHWDEHDFREWTQSLIDRGFIDSKKKYEAGSVPESLDLHFLPFKYGMLYIGNTDPLPQAKLDLGQSMADAFSVAYDRYEDFNKLEQAKKKIEEAFEELEAAQDQLVQQEKLASLGQLTAGIAHEIKNPLNFVNNFSELSIELVEEAREEVREEVKRQKAKGKSDSERSGEPRSETEDRGQETEKGKVKSEKRKSPLSPRRDPSGRGDGIAKGDVRGVSGKASNLSTILEILDDIEANLKTIHKHGTRADGIVKSMLEHSRGGTGEMEPTDVNHLLQEFGNLSYHGMRAGKEPIQVDMVYDLDETIKEIPIVAEDFSRVIVNLCYNSFDAMREKLTGDGRRKTEESLHQPAEGGDPSADGEQRDDAELNYSPKLTIRTKSLANTVTIEIEDNGPGIPDDIIDKIMQPFFTTKKGTQGTGLGLSITNDIIKAHGGNITAANLEKSGARFTINLPAS